jgi:energy-coupling factor transporter ATP-binding protein EcfA2
MRFLIALTGPKGSGKDTVASLIGEIYPDYDINMVAFADPIKTVIEHVFQLPTQGVTLDAHQAYDGFKRSRLSFDLPGIGMQAIDTRHVVREIGMLMRNYDEKQFNEYVRRAVTSECTHAKRIDIVTDLRFDNEYN